MSALRQALGAVEHAVTEENRRGGEARQVVASVGRLVGVDLAHNPLQGNIWSLANMSRVITGVNRWVQRATELERRQVVDLGVIQTHIDELEAQMQELEAERPAGYRQRVEELYRRQSGLEEALAILRNQSKESSE